MNPVLLFFSLNISCAIVFAVLYYLFARVNEIEKKRTFVDELYYAMLTQTTIGYSSGDFNALSNRRKIFNLFQMFSLFVIPAALIWNNRNEASKNIVIAQAEDDSGNITFKVPRSHKHVNNRFNPYSRNSTLNLKEI